VKSINYEAPHYAIISILLSIPLSLWYKYSPQHPFLKHPQSTFFLLCERFFHCLGPSKGCVQSHAPAQHFITRCFFFTVSCSPLAQPPHYRKPYTAYENPSSALQRLGKFWVLSSSLLFKWVNHVSL